MKSVGRAAVSEPQGIKVMQIPKSSKLTKVDMMMQSPGLSRGYRLEIAEGSGGRGVTE